MSIKAMGSGLLQVLNLEQTLQREEGLRAQMSETLPEQTEIGLTSQIRKDWETAKQYRVKTDIRLLECLRARRGEYSAAELSRINQMGGANVIWMDITDAKCRAAKAWIEDVVMPPGEQAWGLAPSPIPDLPNEIKEAVVERAAFAAKQHMVDQAQQGGPWMSRDDFGNITAEIGAAVRDETLKVMRENAAARAERMETVIGEHMVDGGYRQAMTDFIDYFVTYPTAILKGPFFQNQDCMVWEPDWNLNIEQRAKMSWAAVNPFDVYPAPNAMDCQKGAFIERLRLRRDQLYAMIGLPGYNEEAIRGALEDYRHGRIESWLWSEMERRRYENDTIYDWLSPHGVIDALHYWGSVPGAYLMQWGMDPEKIDPVKEYEIDAILIGRYVVRAALNAHPLKKRPYHKASFSRVPGAFWGRAIYDLIKPSQKMCNATACSIADNMAMASGPMMWMYTDRLAPGYTDINPAPWKVYQLVSNKNGADPMSNPGIGYIQTPSNLVELQANYQMFEDRADQTSGIPKYFTGQDSQAPEVARTMAMLLSTQSKGLTQSINEIDINVCTPTIFDAYLYEMLYGPDMSAKGDCNIVARGAAAILVKEAHLENRKQALQMIAASPQALQIVGSRGLAELMRETLKLLDIPLDKIIPSDEELQAREKAAAQATGQDQALQVYQQVEMQKLAQKDRANQTNNQTKVQVEAMKEGRDGPSPEADADRQVELAKDKTRRDLKAGDIQKSLAVSGMAHRP